MTMKCFQTIEFCTEPSEDTLEIASGAEINGITNIRVSIIQQDGTTRGVEFTPGEFKEVVARMSSYLSLIG